MFNPKTSVFLKGNDLKEPHIRLDDSVSSSRHVQLVVNEGGRLTSIGQPHGTRERSWSLTVQEARQLAFWLLAALERVPEK